MKSSPSRLFPMDSVVVRTTSGGGDFCKKEALTIGFPLSMYAL